MYVLHYLYMYVLHSFDHTVRHYEIVYLIHEKYAEEVAAVNEKVQSNPSIYIFIYLSFSFWDKILLLLCRTGSSVSQNVLVIHFLA